MRLIVTANTNECCIYEYDKKNLHLFKALHHPESKLHNIDLVTDKPGQFAHGSFTPKTQPIEKSIDVFAKEIAEQLGDIKNQHPHDHMIIIMPAKMESLVSKKLDKNTKDLITKTVHKNIMYMSTHELTLFVKNKVLVH